MPVRPADLATRSAHDLHGQQRANVSAKQGNPERRVVPPAFLKQTRQVPDAGATSEAACGKSGDRCQVLRPGPASFGDEHDICCQISHVAAPAPIRFQATADALPWPIPTWLLSLPKPRSRI